MSDQIPVKRRDEDGQLGQYEPDDVVPVQFGGTGATDAAGARANLGVPATMDLAPVAISGQYGDLLGLPTLFSGSYNDLTDKPSIPNDNDLLHRFGDETAAGSKTWSGPALFTAGGSGIVPIQSATSSAVSLGLRRTGGSLTGTVNSAVRYEIQYTDESLSYAYFGLASISAAAYYCIGSDANLASGSTSWLRMNATESLFFNTVRAAGVVPRATDTYSLGSPTMVWQNVYVTNPPITSSDARLKTEPRDMSSAEVAAFAQIARLPNIWKWKIGDRTHGGPTVQAAMAIMEAHGLEPFDYACFCYDQWDAKEAVIESWDDEFDPETGELVREAGSQIAEPAVEAGDRYSFRKEELLCFIVAALARQHDDLEARVAALEARA